MPRSAVSAAAPQAVASTVFHEGELAVQERAGSRGMAAKVGHGIRTAVPAIVANFLLTQRIAFVGTLDAAGRPWASVLTGAPGFASAPDELTLRIMAAPTPGDPLTENLRAVAAREVGELARGAPVGVLVVDFTTRRRLRVNGRAALRAGDEIHVDVEQVYSNCHKHIQTRAIASETVRDAPAHELEDVRVQRGRGLDDAQRDWIRRADTFAIASAHITSGADCSHRGGTPGFVRVAGDRLTWPDYQGNGLFNTLGNITTYPRAGLVFVDFDSGATLQLTGSAAVDWDPEHAAAAPGAQRLVTFDVDETIETRAALPFQLQLIERSKFNPPIWGEHPDGDAR
jgi:predicted pyridoxine 5'-phosphate oxidase superfamily flavin-nucleotide-binding protein